MYEQYTDKQIVEMLVPKLNKAVPELDWGEYLKRPDDFSIWNRLISVIYKSDYIRGQLGRSFIIGEKKDKEPVNTFKEKVTEHWVPATRDNVKVGSKVRMIDEEVHFFDPEYIPVAGTVGVVEIICFRTCLVKWPKGTTSDDDTWYCIYKKLEVLLCE